MKKQIVLDFRKIRKIHNKNENDIMEEFNVHKMNFSRWNKKAPDLVISLFNAKKQVNEVDVLKILKAWKNPPSILVFVRNFCIKYDCKFEDIVFEIKITT